MYASSIIPKIRPTSATVGTPQRIPRTIREWQSSRRIPYTKIGKVVLFDLTKIQEALARFERQASGLN